MSAPEWRVLSELLGQPIDLPAVRDVCRESTIDEFPDGGSIVSIRQSGLSLVFDPSDVPAQPKLFVAFHLRSPNYEGFEGYPNGLPCGVVFGDSEETVLGRCGVPMEKGGGYRSEEFRRDIPRWVRMAHDKIRIHFQFAKSGGVDLVTVSRHPS